MCAWFTKEPLAIKAFEEGKKIHLALAEKHQGRGNHIEEAQICYLTGKKTPYYIKAILIGHPD
jgi:hypothetical protein